MLALAVAACAAHVASGQSLDRSKRPATPPEPALRFPAAYSQTLANGLRVVIVEDHALPLVAVRAYVGVDSLSDPAGKEGLFALTARMLREGTATMTADQQLAAIAALGNPVTPFRFTTIVQNFEPSLGLMAGMLAHPALPQDAFARPKAALTAAEHARFQSQSTAPYHVFYRELLGQSDPVTRTFFVSDTSISSITRDDVQRCYDLYFRPANTTVIVVGDVQRAAAMNAVKQAFGGWASRPPVVPVSAQVSIPRAPTTIYLLDRPGAAQSVVLVGTTGPNRESRDFAALEVMAPVFGSTGASRLQQNLRERHSYMYSGAPGIVTWRAMPAPSILGGSALIAAAKTDSALIEWLGELRGIRERAPTPAEMTLAHGALRGALAAQLETDDGIADRLVFLAQNHLPLDYFAGYSARVGKVNANGVAAAATRYIDPAHLVIVVAGDRKVIEPALRAANIAPIVIVDETGKPIG
jgi:zinc protease